MKVKVDTKTQNCTLHKLHPLSPHQTLAMITHTTPRSHWCRKCAKNFSNTYHLRRHIRSNHVKFSKEVHKSKNKTCYCSFFRFQASLFIFHLLGFKLHSSHFAFPAAWWLEEIGGTPEGSKFPPIIFYQQKYLSDAKLSIQVLFIRGSTPPSSLLPAVRGSPTSALPRTLPKLCRKRRSWPRLS